MEVVKEEGKEKLCVDTWEGCQLNCGPRNNKKKSPFMPWSIFSKIRKAWQLFTAKSSGKHLKKRNTKRQIAPEGCFPVYVGAERQRFVIKTEHASHPLFKKLLEDAEMEYGYKSEGPLSLPCDVELFYKVLAEMDSNDDVPRSRSVSPFKSFQLPGNSSSVDKVYGLYELLTPSPLLKMNI